MAYNIRVGEVWYPSFPDADLFTRYSIIEEAIIMNIELNAYGEYYIQYEIMGVLKSQKVEDFVFFYHKKDTLATKIEAIEKEIDSIKKLL